MPPPGLEEFLAAGPKPICIGFGSMTQTAPKEAMRSGVPAIVVPFHGDQFYWAKLVHDLGVGPEGIPRKRLSAERLARAIRQAVDDSDMARRAADLGARVRSEDGVTRAIDAIERFVAQGRR